MNAKERLLEFLKYLSIGQGAFEKVVGISNGYINNNKGSIGSSIVSKICLSYPELNSNWLTNGDGEMLKQLVFSNASPLTDFPFMNIPFVPIHAQGGYAKGYGDQEYIESLPTIPVMVDKNYKGKYRVFEVDGDSMDDGSRNALYDGDKILCREVKQELWTSKLHYKKWFFVICMKNDGITVKQITSHDVDCGKITCHPLNSIFEDFVVDLQEVAELYNVIKIVDRNTRI